MCGPTWMHLRHGSEHTYDHTVYKNDGGGSVCLGGYLQSICSILIHE